MLRLLFRILLSVFYRVRVTGRIPDPLPPRMLIVSNHQSFLDPLLLGAFLPVEPVWVVHTQIARQWHFRMLLRVAPHVVVDAANPLAMKKLLGVIESGRPVAIFPEGRLTVTGSLMKVYDGPAFLAAKTGAAILPVVIDGAMLTYFSRAPRQFRKHLFPRIALHIEPIQHIPMPEAKTARLRRRLASDRMRRVLEESQFAARPRRTLFEAFLQAVRTQGRRDPVLEDIREVKDSYGTILKAALALGRLVSKFTVEGENVGVLMPNASATVFLLFGMFAMRRVPAILNYTSGLEGMQNACHIARVRTLFTSRTFLEKARLTEIVAKLRDVEVLCLEDLRPRLGFGDKVWLMLWALWFPRHVMRPAKPSDPAVILFTSGSEGKPKGVVLSHEGILANIAQMKAIIEFSSKDKFMTALPLFHSFGLTAGAILPLVSGCRVFLYPSPLHYRTIPEIIYDRDCTVVFGTGTFLANYAKTAHPYDFYCLRYVVAGAEKLSEDVRRLWMEKYGIRILEGYGATECSPVISVNTPNAYKQGSVGKLMPGIEAKLEPVQGLEGGGVLHVRAPNIMLGYLLHDAPGVLSPPSSCFGPGWYATGDVVDLDESGFVTIKARVKRFAKVAGEMVSLEVVERIAAGASPGVPHAATTQSDAGRGEVIVLFTQDKNLRRERLVAAAQSNGLPEIAVPRKLILVEKIPLLGNGKVDYVTLKTMADDLPARAAQQGQGDRG